ncbi:MAG: fibronectin type III domain-containing protein, partial [Candidatus Omnitrophica bacterium]|nr:fibronectin type III domain-containing protein [Candidatus Omnitrophota bacterium]
YVHDGKLYVGGWNAMGESNWQGTYLSTNLQGNGWHHVALTLKGGPTISADVLKGYLDGAEFGRGAGSQLWEHAALIGIGGMNNATRFHDEAIMDGNGHYLKGRINGVEIYNRELSAREIGVLAKTAVPSIAPSSLNLTNIQAVPSSDSALIRWTTDVLSNGQVEYSIHSDMSQPQYLFSNDSIVRFHSVMATGLKANTVYYYRVKSSDLKGNVKISEVKSFTTLPLPDTTAPIVSNISVTAAPSTATITWTTDEASDTQVEYATNGGMSGFQSSPLNSAMVTQHSVTLSQLNPDTQYYYRVRSKDQAGNVIVSAVNFFTTRPLPDTTPPALSNIKVTALVGGVNISWTTNELSDTQVEYSTDKSMRNSLFSPLNSSLTAQHSVTVSGLNIGTPYYYRIRSKDQSGNLTISEVSTFSPLPAPDTKPPSISNIQLVSAADGAKITWTTDEASDTQVEYAINPEMEDSQLSPINEKLVTQHSATLSGLNRLTAYYYRVRSKDAAGNLTLSSISVFKTVPPPPSAPLPPRQSINDANISIQAGFNIKSIVLYDFLQSNNSARNTFNEFYQGYVFIPQAGARNDNNPGQYILLRDFLNQITNKLGYNQAAHLDNLQKALSLRAKLGNITLIKDFETFYGTRPSGRLHLISKDLALKAVSQPGYNEAYLLKNLPVITQIYTQARDMQNGLNYPTGFRFFDMIFGTNLPRGTEFTGAFLSDQDRQILFNAYETFKSELPSAINSQTSIQAITGWLNIIHGMATIYNTIKTDPSRGPAFFGINGSITTTGPLTDKDRALLYTAAKNVAAKTSLAIIIKGDPNLVKYFGALFDERWKPGKIYVFDDSSQRVLFEYIANTPSFNLGEFLTALKKAGEFHTAYFPTAKINDVFQEIFSWNGAPNKNAISGGTILLKLVSMPGYVPANLRSQISMAYSINLLLKKDGAAMAALNNLYKLGTNNLAKGYLLMEVAANYGITFPGVFVESVKKADATIKLLLANPAKLNKFNTKYGAVLSAANYSTGIPVGTLKKLIQLINSNYYTFTPQAFVNSL